MVRKYQSLNGSRNNQNRSSMEERKVGLKYEITIKG